MEEELKEWLEFWEGDYTESFCIEEMQAAFQDGFQAATKLAAETAKKYILDSQGEIGVASLAYEVVDEITAAIS